MEIEANHLAWQERPLAELLRLSWPITVSMLSFSIMTLVDTLLVGHLGAAALAGVGMGGTAAFAEPLKSSRTTIESAPAGFSGSATLRRSGTSCMSGDS